MAYSLIMLGPPLQTEPRHTDISQVRTEEEEIIITNKQFIIVNKQLLFFVFYTVI